MITRGLCSGALITKGMRVGMIKKTINYVIGIIRKIRHEITV